MTWRAVFGSMLGIAILTSASALAAGRILEEEFPAPGIRTVAIDAGVGDVEVSAGTQDTIRVTVELSPRLTGIPLLHSNRRAREQISQARLHVERGGDTLKLRVAAPREDHKFREKWTLVLPERLATDIDLGVGDVRVSGTSGGVTLDLGVGDAKLHLAGGDVDADVGVGDLEIVARLELVRSVDADTGVGDAELELPDRKIRGSGMVSKSLAWKGSGTARLSANVGVGDVHVVLRAAD